MQCRCQSGERTTEIDLLKGFRARPDEPGRAHVVQLLHASANSGIGLHCQFGHEREKSLRLAVEQSHGRQELHHAHGDPIGLRGTDDRAPRQVRANERARLRHDQVRLEQLSAEGCAIQVREGDRYAGDRIFHVRQWRCVARLVLPCLEMHRFRRANADQDAQHLDAGRALCHGGIQTGSTLLDRSEVESGGVGYGLKEIGIR